MSNFERNNEIDQSFIDRALSQSLKYKNETKNNNEKTKKLQKLLEKEYSGSNTLQIYREEAELPESTIINDNNLTEMTTGNLNAIHIGNKSNEGDESASE